MKEHIAVSIFLVAAAGCAYLPSVGPDYEEPVRDDELVSLPDAGYPTTNLTAGCEYRPAESNDDSRVEITANELAEWWKRFNDPVLADLVENALTNNLTYKIAIKRLEQASYELLGSFAAFMPKFGLGGGWTHHYYEDYSASGGSATRYNAQNIALDGNWEIDVFGGNRRQAEASFSLAEAAYWDVADAWVALTTQLGSQYVHLRTTQERLEVARTNLVLQSETYDILRSRLDSGIGDELAVNQCAYIVEQTRANIPQLLAQEERLKNAIAILAGKTPGELEETLAPVKVRRDWLLAPQKISELPLDLLRGRPDVKAAERALAAQTAYIGVAKAQWFPKLYVSGQVGFKNTNEQRLFSKDSFFALLGPSISWPIFQGGAIYANVKATEAKMEQAAARYELTLDNALGEVRDAYSAYTQEYHRYQSLKSAVKAATDAVTISKDLYKNGLKDFNNVLDAQRSRLQLEEAYAISRGQITLDLISLYRALGGGLASIPEED